MILLDTCTLLWLAQGDKKLSKKALEHLQLSEEPLYISAISALEIGTEYRKKRLKLPLKPNEWWDKILEFYDIQALPVSSSIAFLSTRLEPIHRDPADRIIIATASENKLKILTPDKHIKAYKQAKVVW